MEDEIIDLKLENFIYKKMHLQIATFFGGPLAIVYILAVNFKQLGYPEKVRKTWIIGLFLFVIFIVSVMMLQFTIKSPSYLPSLISILIGTAIMQSWQGDDIQHHVENGGPVYPLSRSLLIGIVCLMGTLVFIILLLLILNNFFGVNIPEKSH
jgi:uncharacterized membrane protein AbrB (regulator of aidB expression)